MDRKALFRAAGVLLGSVGTIFAQVTGAVGQSVEQFYSGRTIALVVPAATGGINDLAGRLVAKHISRFIPGHPTIVPENRAGEGGNGLLNEFAATTARGRAACCPPTGGPG